MSRIEKHGKHSLDGGTGAHPMGTCPGAFLQNALFLHIIRFLKPFESEKRLPLTVKNLHLASGGPNRYGPAPIGCCLKPSSPPWALYFLGTPPRPGRGGPQADHKVRPGFAPAEPHPLGVKALHRLHMGFPPSWARRWGLTDGRSAVSTMPATEAQWGACPRF